MASRNHHVTADLGSHSGNKVHVRDEPIKLVSGDTIWFGDISTIIKVKGSTAGMPPWSKGQHNSPMLAEMSTLISSLSLSPSRYSLLDTDAASVSDDETPAVTAHSPAMSPTLSPTINHSGFLNFSRTSCTSKPSLTTDLSLSRISPFRQRPPHSSSTNTSFTPPMLGMHSTVGDSMDLVPQSVLCSSTELDRSIPTDKSPAAASFSRRDEDPNNSRHKPQTSSRSSSSLSPTRDRPHHTPQHTPRRTPRSTTSLSPLKDRPQQSSLPPVVIRLPPVQEKSASRLHPTFSSTTGNHISQHSHATSHSHITKHNHSATHGQNSSLAQNPANFNGANKSRGFAFHDHLVHQNRSPERLLHPPSPNASRELRRQSSLPSIRYCSRDAQPSDTQLRAAHSSSNVTTAAPAAEAAAGKAACTFSIQSSNSLANAGADAGGTEQGSISKIPGALGDSVVGSSAGNEPGGSGPINQSAMASPTIMGLPEKLDSGFGSVARSDSAPAALGGAHTDGCGGSVDRFVGSGDAHVGSFDRCDAHVSHSGSHMQKSNDQMSDQKLECQGHDDTLQRQTGLEELAKKINSGCQRAQWQREQCKQQDMSSAMVHSSRIALSPGPCTTNLHATVSIQVSTALASESSSEHTHLPDTAATTRKVDTNHGIMPSSNPCTLTVPQSQSPKTSAWKKTHSSPGCQAVTIKRSAAKSPCRQANRQPTCNNSSQCQQQDIKHASDQASKPQINKLSQDHAGRSMSMLQPTDHLYDKSYQKLASKLAKHQALAGTSNRSLTTNQQGSTDSPPDSGQSCQTTSNRTLECKPRALDNTATRILPLPTRHSPEPKNVNEFDSRRSQVESTELDLNTESDCYQDAVHDVTCSTGKLYMSASEQQSEYMVAASQPVTSMEQRFPGVSLTQASTSQPSVSIQASRSVACGPERSAVVDDNHAASSSSPSSPGTVCAIDQQLWQPQPYIKQQQQPPPKEQQQLQLKQQQKQQQQQPQPCSGLQPYSQSDKLKHHKALSAKPAFFANVTGGGRSGGCAHHPDMKNSFSSDVDSMSHASRSEPPSPGRGGVPTPFHGSVNTTSITSPWSPASAAIASLGFGLSDISPWPATITHTPSSSVRRAAFEEAFELPHADKYSCKDNVYSSATDDNGACNNNSYSDDACGSDACSNESPGNDACGNHIIIHQASEIDGNSCSTQFDTDGFAAFENRSKHTYSHKLKPNIAHVKVLVSGSQSASLSASPASNIAHDKALILNSDFAAGSLSASTSASKHRPTKAANPRVGKPADSEPQQQKSKCFRRPQQRSAPEQLQTESDDCRQAAKHATVISLSRGKTPCDTDGPANWLNPAAQKSVATPASPISGNPTLVDQLSLARKASNPTGVQGPGTAAASDFSRNTGSQQVNSTKHQSSKSNSTYSEHKQAVSTTPGKDKTPVSQKPVRQSALQNKHARSPEQSSCTPTPEPSNDGRNTYHNISPHRIRPGSSSKAAGMSNSTPPSESIEQGQSSVAAQKAKEDRTDGSLQPRSGSGSGASSSKANHARPGPPKSNKPVWGAPPRRRKTLPTQAVASRRKISSSSIPHSTPGSQTKVQNNAQCQDPAKHVGLPVQETPDCLCTQEPGLQTGTQSGSTSRLHVSGQFMDVKSEGQSWYHASMQEKLLSGADRAAVLSNAANVVERCKCEGLEEDGETCCSTNGSAGAHARAGLVLSPGQFQCGKSQQQHRNKQQQQQKQQQQRWRHSNVKLDITHGSTNEENQSDASPALSQLEWEQATVLTASCSFDAVCEASQHSSMPSTSRKSGKTVFRHEDQPPQPSYPHPIEEVARPCSQAALNSHDVGHGIPPPSLVPQIQAEEESTAAAGQPSVSNSYAAGRSTDHVPQQLSARNTDGGIASRMPTFPGSPVTGEGIRKKMQQLALGSACALDEMSEALVASCDVSARDSLGDTSKRRHAAAGSVRTGAGLPPVHQSKSKVPWFTIPENDAPRMSDVFKASRQSHELFRSYQHVLRSHASSAPDVDEVDGLCNFTTGFGIDGEDMLERRHLMQQSQSSMLSSRTSRLTTSDSQASFVMLPVYPERTTFPMADLWLREESGRASTALHPFTTKNDAATAASRLDHYHHNHNGNELMQGPCPWNQHQLEPVKEHPATQPSEMITDQYSSITVQYNGHGQKHGQEQHSDYGLQHGGAPSGLMDRKQDPILTLIEEEYVPISTTMEEVQRISSPPLVPFTELLAAISSIARMNSMEAS